MNGGWKLPGPGTGMDLAAGAAAYGGATGDMSPEVRGWFFILAVLFMYATLVIEVFHQGVVPLGKHLLSQHEEED